MTRTTKIARRDPFAELHAFVDSAFSQRPNRRPVNLFAPWGLFPNPARTGAPAPARNGIPVNLFETDDGIGLEFSLPGFAEDEISVTVDDGVLAISAEHKSAEHKEDAAETPSEGPDGDGEAGAGRRYTRREISRVALARSFRIGNEYDPESAAASLANGLLEVTLSRLPEAEPKRIPIAAGAGS